MSGNKTDILLPVFTERCSSERSNLIPENILLRIDVFQQHSAPLSYTSSSSNLKLLKIITVSYCWPLCSSLQQLEMQCFAQEHLSETDEGVLLFTVTYGCISMFRVRSRDENAAAQIISTAVCLKIFLTRLQTALTVLK